MVNCISNSEEYVIRNETENIFTLGVFQILIDFSSQTVICDVLVGFGHICIKIV